MEQQVTPTLVVSHVSVLQMLIAYFRNSPVEKCMDIAIPLHTVIKFTPARGGGWSESIHPLVVTPTESQERKTSSNPTNIPVVAEQQGFLSLFHNWPFHKSDIPSNGEKDNSLKTVLDDRIHRGTLVAGAASAAPVLGARK